MASLRRQDNAFIHSCNHYGGINGSDLLWQVLSLSASAYLSSFRRSAKYMQQVGVGGRMIKDSNAPMPAKPTCTPLCQDSQNAPFADIINISVLELKCEL